jgi:queuine tRNA-ribosyltransferase
MGVGYAIDLVVSCALGVDMFDCVYPTRTARFGTALVDGPASTQGGKLLSGTLHLNSSKFEHDYRPIDDSCSCMVCQKYSRAYLHGLVGKEGIGSQLLTYHNIAYQLQLMRRLRQSIVDNSFPDFAQDIMKSHFPNRNYPLWCVEALQASGITLA